MFTTLINPREPSVGFSGYVPSYRLPKHLDWICNSMEMYDPHCRVMTHIVMFIATFDLLVSCQAARPTQTLVMAE